MCDRGARAVVVHENELQPEAPTIHDNTVNVVWHHNERINGNIPKVRRNSRPAPHQDILNLFTLKQQLPLMGADRDEVRTRRPVVVAVEAFSSRRSRRFHPVTSSLQQWPLRALLLLLLWRQAEVLVGAAGGDRGRAACVRGSRAGAGRARRRPRWCRLLGDRGGDRLEADRAAVEALDDRAQEAAVDRRRGPGRRSRGG